MMRRFPIREEIDVKNLLFITGKYSRKGKKNSRKEIIEGKVFLLRRDTTKVKGYLGKVIFVDY